LVESRQYIPKAVVGEDIELDKDDGIHVQPRGQFHKLRHPPGYHPFVVRGTIYKDYLGFVCWQPTNKLLGQII
jgi:hypothetical protein